MTNALDWLRSNDAADGNEDDMSLGIGSIATIKQIKEPKAQVLSSGYGVKTRTVLQW